MEPARKSSASTARNYTGESTAGRFTTRRPGLSNGRARCNSDSAQGVSSQPVAPTENSDRTGNPRGPRKPNMPLPRPTDCGATRRKLSTLPEIVEHPNGRKMVRSVQEQREWLDHLQIERTQNPAPTVQESERAQYMADRFRELGLQHVRLDKAGNALGERT